MKQLDLFRIVEPESDLEKLDSMVSYEVTSVSEPTEERLPYRTYPDTHFQSESDLEKLESELYNRDKYSLDYRDFCLHEAMEDIVSDCRDQLDIIDFDIDSAIESGDKERLSQLVELRKSYMS